MAEYVRVAVDAMGGDNAPLEIVKGAVCAVNANSQVRVLLLGDETAVRTELATGRKQIFKCESVRMSVLTAAGTAA